VKVFISYTRDDRRSADYVANRLRANGHDVWIDVEGIIGGSNWRQSVRSALEDADWVIVLLSSKSVDSSVVNAEILISLQLNKPILPVLIEKTVIPVYLAGYQYLDATEGLDQAFDDISAFFQEPETEKANIQPAPPEVLHKLESEVADTPLPDRIFIAYARAQRPIARELAEMLHKAGKAVFYDAHIQAGARWRKIVQAALEDATHLVILWTVEATDSNEVDLEVSYALAEGKYIIPILSKDIPKLPYHLHGLHYLVLEEDLQGIELDLLSAIEQPSTGTSGIWQ
jgi:hypothetical protein